MKNLRSVVSKDGTKIVYEKMGRRDAIILVLGALNSRKSGVKLAKLLADRFTVINYDRRGRGDSTDSSTYAPEREIEDISALIADAGERVSLYGHSSGAALVLETAIQLSKQIKKIAIYEAPYSLDDEAIQAAKKYSQQLKKLLAAGKNGDAVALFVRNVGVSDKQIAAMKRLPMWRGLVGLAPTLAYDSDVLGEGHALPVGRLKKIKIPVLVMHGGKSPLFMRETAKAISDAIPNSQLQILANQTHGVSPKALSPVLEKFFYS